MKFRYLTVKLIKPYRGCYSVLIRWVVSQCVVYVMQYLARPEVESVIRYYTSNETIQPSRSIHSNSIPFIIYIDKEDKTHFHTFRLFLISSFKGNNNDLQHNSVLKTPQINIFLHILRHVWHLVVYCITFIKAVINRI